MATLQSLLVRLSPAEDERLDHGVLCCVLGLSIGQVAALVGRSKSAVYRAMASLGRAVAAFDPFPASRHFSGVLALDEKWVQVPKSFIKEEREAGSKWRYVFFAVDGISGVLLHIDRFTQAWGTDGPESLVGSECTPLAGPADKQEAQPVGPSPPATSEPGCEEVPLRVAV